ncbi:MAG TPA: type II toxin-antitoxin system RelE/ParE family toxin [Dehalococcoidia bacterium]|nr:type II toxin-antitoxin system RelE/ParE family toxin [Dehalococcoidia bacterium]
MTSEQPWAIEFYRDERGVAPVEEFLSKLDSGMRSKVSRALGILEALGPRLPMPFARPVVGYRFWELRVQTGGNQTRVFYVAVKGRRIVLLHAFAKKTQRTPARELDIASRRWSEVLRESK